MHNLASICYLRLLHVRILLNNKGDIVKLKDISTKYLLMEYYLQNFTYLRSKDKHLYNLIERELRKRKELS